jgi:hypothetical protein
MPLYPRVRRLGFIALVNRHQTRHVCARRHSKRSPLGLLAKRASTPFFNLEYFLASIHGLLRPFGRILVAARCVR